MDFQIEKAPNGIQSKNIAVASATVIEYGDIIGETSGLAVKAGASTAKIAFAMSGSAAGETTPIIACNDKRLVLKGKGDAVFAVAQRGSEVDLVIKPGYLTTGATKTTVAVLAAITDASFRVTIDGTGRNVDALDLSSGTPTTMAAIAALIQTALRTATSASETVTWDSTNEKFIISSVTASDSGTVTVLSTSTGTVGTDISGKLYLNGDSGAGVVTDPRQSIDVGASSTDVFIVEPGTDAGVVGSADNILVTMNKTI